MLFYSQILESAVVKFIDDIFALVNKVAALIVFYSFFFQDFLKKIFTSIGWIDIISLSLSLKTLYENLDLLFFIQLIPCLNFGLFKDGQLIKSDFLFFQLNFNYLLFLFFFLNFDNFLDV